MCLPWARQPARRSALKQLIPPSHVGWVSDPAHPSKTKPALTPANRLRQETCRGERRSEHRTTNNEHRSEERDRAESILRGRGFQPREPQPRDHPSKPRPRRRCRGRRPRLGWVGFGLAGITDPGYSVWLAAAVRGLCSQNHENKIIRQNESLFMILLSSPVASNRNDTETAEAG